MPPLNIHSNCLLFKIKQQGFKHKTIYQYFPDGWIPGDEKRKEHMRFEEKKIVYYEGEDVRVLRGKITEEDDFFITVKRRDGEQRINKKVIIRIVEGNHNG